MTGWLSVKLSTKNIACENIRFSLLFAAGDVSGGEERREMDVFAGNEKHYQPILADLREEPRGPWSPPYFNVKPKPA